MSQLKKYKHWIYLLSLLAYQNGIAGNNDSTHKFTNFKLSRIVLTGNAYCGFDFHLNDQLKDSTGMTSTSVSIGLAPIVAWKITPRLFFESEIDLMMAHGMLSTEIGYANLSYNFSKFCTVQIGKFLSPFGIFSERYHPFWINYAPNEPLGFSHEGYSPESELGICLRKGCKHFNYAMYLSLGATMDAGNQNSNDAGKIIFHTELGSKINDKISVGGRIGILPFKNSSLELGVSYKRMQLEPGVGNMFALDLSVQKIIPKLKGRIDSKGQVNYTDAGKNNFIKLNTSGTAEIPYNFSNISKIGFILLSYKPIFAENSVIKNSGIFVRGGAMELPTGALWYENTNEFTFGLNYSFNWHNIIKLGYQQIISSKKGYTNNIMIQWAVGF